jgi:hypothetical protein
VRPLFGERPRHHKGNNSAEVIASLSTLSAFSTYYPVFYKRRPDWIEVLDCFAGAHPPRWYGADQAMEGL